MFLTEAFHRAQPRVRLHLARGDRARERGDRGEVRRHSSLPWRIVRAEWTSFTTLDDARHLFGIRDEW